MSVSIIRSSQELWGKPNQFLLQVVIVTLFILLQVLGEKLSQIFLDLIWKNTKQILTILRQKKCASKGNFEGVCRVCCWRVERYHSVLSNKVAFPGALLQERAKKVQRIKVHVPRYRYRWVKETNSSKVAFYSSHFIVYFVNVQIFSLILCTLWQSI